MKQVNEVVKKVYGKYPEKVLQIGDGNFLRAFVDWMIDEANESGAYKASIVVCAPLTGGKIDALNAQDGIYTLVARGLQRGKAVSKSRQITSISRAIKIKDDYKAFLEIAKNPDLQVIVSNTTEAGISYKEGENLAGCPNAFPAKMAAFLYERYKAFKGDPKKGLLFLPCELNDHNADLLKKCILQYSKDFAFEKAFFDWLENSNIFANTLVDRIVTGYPKEGAQDIEKELGYKDDLIVSSEIFNFWAIEGKKEISEIFPVHKASANVLWTDNIDKYKKRKVRILNGGHTALSLAAYLAGHNFVLDFMNDEIFKGYLNDLLSNEIIPAMDMPKEDLSEYAKDVCDRFANPYIKHSLLDIALNSCAKFNTRCLPSIIDSCKKTGKAPKLLTFSFAAFIKFYLGKMEDGSFYGKRDDGTKYQIRDGASVINFFSEFSDKNISEDEIVKAVLSNTAFWDGSDLTRIEGLAESVSGHLKKINESSIKESLIKISGTYNESHFTKS